MPQSGEHKTLSLADINKEKKTGRQHDMSAACKFSERARADDKGRRPSRGMTNRLVYKAAGLSSPSDGAPSFDGTLGHEGAPRVVDDKYRQDRTCPPFGMRITVSLRPAGTGAVKGKEGHASLYRTVSPSSRIRLLITIRSCTLGPARGTV